MSRRNANVNSYQALALAGRATPQPTAAGSVLGHDSESSKEKGSMIRKQKDKELGSKKKGRRNKKTE